jgi:hypothetical protein
MLMGDRTLKLLYRLAVQRVGATCGPRSIDLRRDLSQYSVGRKMIFSIGRLFFLASAFLLLATIPTELVAEGPTICVFKRLLGRDCLGCGMTRALSILLHGNLALALSYNKLVVVVLPTLCFVLLKDVVSVFHFAIRDKWFPTARRQVRSESFRNEP